jgi:hypothetical protein
VADEPNTAVMETGAPEGEIEAPSEPESYTLEDLRGLPVEKLREIAPQIDEHISAETAALSQREMQKLLPGKEAEIREMIARENEDKWLDYLRANIVTEADELKVFRAEKDIAKARSERDQKSLDRTDVEKARLGKRVEDAKRLADKVWALAPEAVDALASRKWAAGDEGIDEYIEALTDLYAEHKVKGRESLIETTARKSALGDNVPESPEVNTTSGASRRVPESYAWFDKQPLEVRQVIRQDKARYERILATR